MADGKPCSRKFDLKNFSIGLELANTNHNSGTRMFKTTIHTTVQRIVQHIVHTATRIIICTATITAVLGFSSINAMAGKADVVAATAHQSGGSWQVSATIKHADEGWKHYANSFQVLSMDGKVLGTRILHHPHVNEQPFTRSLSGVKIPNGTTKIRVRAGDLVHGYGGKEVVVELTK